MNFAIETLQRDLRRKIVDQETDQRDVKNLRDQVKTYQQRISGRAVEVYDLQEALRKLGQ